MGHCLPPYTRRRRDPCDLFLGHPLASHCFNFHCATYHTRTAHDTIGGAASLPRPGSPASIPRSPTRTPFTAVARFIARTDLPPPHLDFPPPPPSLHASAYHPPRHSIGSSEQQRLIPMGNERPPLSSAYPMARYGGRPSPGRGYGEGDEGLDRVGEWERGRLVWYRDLGGGEGTPGGGGGRCGGTVL